jgi:hypothetical protein
LEAGTLEARRVHCRAAMKISRMIGMGLLAVACGGESDGSSDDALEKNTTAYEGAYKSPSIVRDDATYHAYFAKSTIGGKTFNVPHATFDENDKWTKPHEALPKLGKDADPNGDVWAPAAAMIRPNHWMLFYTATLAGHGEKKCIWRAHATSGEGPFVDDYDGPIVCPDASEWALDAYLVRDLHDRWVLGMRFDVGNAINTIQIRQLNDEATHLAAGSQMMELTQNHQGSWDQHVMENAGIVRLSPPNGNGGHWYVFYSAKHWDDDTYSIGVADCGATLLDAARGECKKLTPIGPWMQSGDFPNLFAPGTPTFYTDGKGTKLMSIQAWRYKGGVAPKSPNLEENRKQGQIMRTFTIEIDNQYQPHAKEIRVDM